MFIMIQNIPMTHKGHMRPKNFVSYHKIKKAFELNRNG